MSQFPTNKKKKECITMAKMYYEKDCELSYLNGKKIASSATAPRATPTPQPEGLRVRCVRRPAGRLQELGRGGEGRPGGQDCGRGRQWGDIVMMLINDEVQAESIRMTLPPT